VIGVNGFDIGLLILLALLVLFGLIKGLTRLLIGMGALIVGFLLAAQFHQQLAVKLTWINVNEDILKLIAYVMIFFGTMVVGGLLAWAARKLLKAAMLSWADRLAGGAVGLVAAMLIAAWLVLPLVAYSPFGEKALRDSTLAPYVTVVADLAKRLVPEELSDSYNKKIEDLREYWRERWQETPSSLEARRPRPGSVA
jgi:membrane protein required for colicin V production